MSQLARPLSVGFPRMHKEAAERRDFLPDIVARLAACGAEVAVERGIGSGMGYRDEDYSSAGATHVVDEADAYARDVVVVLRSPEGRYDLLRPGAVLVSMLHFPTRPARVRMLERMHIDAVSLDMVADDSGRRLVENLESVAWNGVGAGFHALEGTWPDLWTQGRRPVRVTVIGAGRIGRHAVEAATKYGDVARNEAFARAGLAGVEVVTIGRNLTRDATYLRERLAATDLLVDATQRDDAATPIVPNAWLATMPGHAVVCDLVVDPYLLDATPRVVRGIEGIPQGNLDRWELPPDDPAWDDVPASIPHAVRRTVVSCYSWPGVRPEACMRVYGTQLAPMLETLVAAGGISAIRADGTPEERALWRATLRRWLASGSDIGAQPVVAAI